MGIGEALGLRIKMAAARILAPLLPRQDLLASVLPRNLRPVALELKRLERLSDPRNVYAYCLACSID